MTPLARVSTPASVTSGQKERSRDRRREQALARSKAPGGREEKGREEGRRGERRREQALARSKAPGRREGRGES